MGIVELWMESEKSDLVRINMQSGFKFLISVTLLWDRGDLA